MNVACPLSNESSIYVIPIPIHKCFDAHFPAHRRIPPLEFFVPIASDGEGCDSFCTNDHVVDNESECRWIPYDIRQYGEAIRIIRQVYFTAAKALGALTVAFGVQSRNQHTRNVRHFCTSSSNSVLAGFRLLLFVVFLRPFLFRPLLLLQFLS